MEQTGVFATPEELERLRELATRARSTPVILLFGKFDVAGDARRHAYEECHKAALAHGLPEIPGYYGIDESGEFVRV